MSKVSVVIPFYNPGEYILEALDSVFTQTYEDWRLILIDDASTDNTVSLIEEYLEDPRVHLVRHEHNQGQSNSMNTGLKLVETPFLIQLDADDWFNPQTLEILLHETENHADDIAVFSGNINVVFEETKKEVSRIRNGKLHGLKKRMRLQKRLKTKERKGQIFQDRYDFLMANRSIWPRFYRTSALRSIGGWPIDDPYEGRYAEDLRVLFRLIEHYRFHWVDEVLMNHRRHNNNQTKNVSVYNEMFEWTIRDALKRWNDEYEPIFKTDEVGWKTIVQLREKN